MKGLKNMKKLFLLGLISFTITGLLAYNVTIINDTNLEIKAYPEFAAALTKTKWSIKPHATFKENTGIYCTQSIKIEAFLANAKGTGKKNPVYTQIYKPEYTGAGMRCGDYTIKVNITLGPSLQIVNL